MSDYFGALLRSTGAPPPAVAGVLAQRGDEIEREALVEAGTGEISASPFPDGPSVSAVETRGHASSEPTPPVQAPPHLTPHALPATPDAPRRAPASSSPRPAIGDEVHPLVRAALAWVAADPVVVERPVSETTEAPPASDATMRNPSPAVASPSARTVRPAQARPQPAIARDTGLHPTAPSPAFAQGASARKPRGGDPGLREPAAPRIPSARARELNLTPPREPRVRLVPLATDEPSAAAQPDFVEVHIGTIHVAVDAPPAPRAAAPPPPSPRPQAIRPAPRQGFSRARLPRF